MHRISIKKLTVAWKHPGYKCFRVHNGTIALPAKHLPISVLSWLHTCNHVTFRARRLFLHGSIPGCRCVPGFRIFPFRRVDALPSGYSGAWPFCALCGARQCFLVPECAGAFDRLSKCARTFSRQTSEYPMSYMYFEISIIFLHAHDFCYMKNTSWWMFCLQGKPRFIRYGCWFFVVFKR